METMNTVFIGPVWPMLLTSSEVELMETKNPKTKAAAKNTSDFLGS